MVAIVEADINCRLCAGKKQAGLLWVGAQNVHPASGALVAGQSVDDGDPGFAAVGGAPYERYVGVLCWGQRWGSALGGDAGGNVGGINVVAGRNGVEVGVRRRVSNVAYVVPYSGAVHGVVDLPVAAHGPHHAPLDGGD